MEIDIYEVIEAAKTKPFGFQAFYPGPGLGGHCIPIDPFYLTYKAREYDLNTRFIELAGEINTYMPYYVIERTVQGLNSQGRTINGARVLVVGVAYKKDVDDLRESPGLKLIELLLKRGAQVDYHDPYIPVMRRTRRYDFKLTWVPLTPENLAKYDAVLIVTDHSGLDYPLIARHSRLVVDTRNVLPPGEHDGRVIKA
jgi:UDP-N-acetyl-D-glucosamine dehydrogenase